MDDGGLRKKKGFLGRVLFSSVMWSLGVLALRCGMGRRACTRSCDQYTLPCGNLL